MLDNSDIIPYSIVLLLLIVLSAFFSCAETGLMSINRYRLRHKAHMKKRSAVLILKLLKRPDRLLGAILIGNTVANVAASALATVLTITLWGESRVFATTLILTIIILIFAEVTPKTMAALYPDRTSQIVAWPIRIMLFILYPLVWLINVFTNTLLRLMRVKFANRTTEPLNREELRSVVYEATGKVPHRYQSMLLGILDLNTMTVDDVMVPRHKIVGIDIEQKWEKTLEDIANCGYEWAPVFRENINQTIGVLHMRELTKVTLMGELNQGLLMKMLHEPYFIPEGTLLNIQLQYFQQKQERMALAVDEYGEIKGLLTLKDILQEIVGEFTLSVSAVSQLIRAQGDGSYLVEGRVTIRALNRAIHSKLPTRGARTVNGLIVEYLETIPRVGTCVRIADYPIEIVEVEENRVKTARIFPLLKRVPTD